MLNGAVDADASPLDPSTSRKNPVIAILAIVGILAHLRCDTDFARNHFWQRT